MVSRQPQYLSRNRNTVFSDKGKADKPLYIVSQLYIQICQYLVGPNHFFLQIYWSQGSQAKNYNWQLIKQLVLNSRQESIRVIIDTVDVKLV
jgi:hypothetical protein